MNELRKRMDSIERDMYRANAVAIARWTRLESLMKNGEELDALEKRIENLEKIDRVMGDLLELEGHAFSDRAGSPQFVLNARQALERLRGRQAGSAGRAKARGNWPPGVDDEMYVYFSGGRDLNEAFGEEIPFENERSVFRGGKRRSKRKSQRLKKKSLKRSKKSKKTKRSRK